jgi:Putative auto-transporter adhesin, head GIN domain
MALVTVYKHLLPTLVCCLFVLTGCKKSGFFMKEGDMTRTKVSLPDFNEIELHDRINLVLIQDSLNENVEIEAGKNILQHLEVLVTENKLTLRDKSRFRWTRDLDYTITVYITKRTFRQITYYGAGNITSLNTLKVPVFTIDSYTGTGSIKLQLDAPQAEFHIRMANADITVEGKAQYTRLYCADHGSVDLSNFSTNEMTMDYRSIRNSYVNVSNLLTANMLYKGNVYYLGRPEVKALYTNSGKLIPYQ